MNRTSWIIDSQRFAKKIKNASGTLDPSKQKWVSNPTMECNKCGHVMDNSDVVQPWPGLPLGVKFDPSEQELLLHLLAKHGKEGRKPHPFVEEFIPTLEEEDGICYTHPHKLPGVKQDGSISHFFHRTFKAYNTGTRKRRKINTGNLGDVRWHKTGNTKPVLVDGKHLGCKKILVLYMSPVKGGKAEKTNWVMHQYHLGTGEDEKDGEYVVSKLFYQYKPGKKTTQESAATDGVDSVAEADIPDLPPLPSEEDIGTNEVVARGPEHNPYEVNGTFEINIEGNAVEETAALLLSEKPEDPEVALSLSEKPEDPEVALPTSEKPGDPELPQSQDLKLWEGDSQQFELLDSQQLAEGIALCDEFLLSQSQTSCGDGDGDEPKPIKPRLAVYAQLPAEDLKKDLEECQKMGEPLDNTSLDLDGGNEFRLSQIEFSQDSFSAWGAGGKMIDD